MLSNEKEMDSHKSKTVVVEKDVDIDVGTLLTSDCNALDLKALKSQPNLYLKDLTRDNLQLLINEVWKLPVERVDEVIVATLPAPGYTLPRSHGIPKPKPLTKWQQFAKEKGIQSNKKKKPKLKWDDQLQKYLPTYGYKKVKAQDESQWVVEAKDDDKMEDVFSKMKESKREKQSKNEWQRLRNIAKSNNIKIPRVGLPSKQHFPASQELSEALTVARKSTASIGKFQNKLPKEKEAKGIAQEMAGMKKKRKGAPLNMTEEKRRNKGLVDNVLKEQTKILREDYSTGTTEMKQSTAKSGKKKKTGKTSKSGKKPKAGKGQRSGPKRVTGRKRR